MSSSIITNLAAKSFSIEALGRPIYPEFDKFLKEKIASIINPHRPVDNKKHSDNLLDFPGMQPVSLNKENVGLLLKHDYHVCEKSDGIRILGLMIYKQTSTESARIPTLYITDRKYQFREIEDIAFPTIRSLSSFHNDTIVDGELVWDRDNNGSHSLSLYLFDLLALNGASMLELNLLQRFDKLWKEVVRPWEELQKSNPFPSPFRVILKENFKSYYVAHVIPKLPHENDGLIFTPVDQPYKRGTCNKLFKWKPPELNTIDFWITPSPLQEDVWELLASTNGTPILYSYFYLDFEKAAGGSVSSIADIKTPNCIAELFWDPEWKRPVDNLGSYQPEKGGWRFFRMRTDKKLPNDVKVIERIQDSILNGCTEEEVSYLLILAYHSSPTTA